ncbi:MAG: GTP-binding protein [Caldilineaceae bacterium]|nr:GTP-binding protein [Caldilineaceae bacterium]
MAKTTRKYHPFLEQTLITLSKKVCLLGEFAVGKTSLVRRFVYDLFDDRYISTIGVRVSRKTVAVPIEEQLAELTLMVWDLAGSEEFNRVSMSYLRGAAGAILVYDLTRANTFDQLYNYVLSLYKVNPHAKVVLAGNKLDLVDRHQMDTGKAEKLATELNAPLFFTSARQGEEVDNLFRHLGRLLVS